MKDSLEKVLPGHVCTASSAHVLYVVDYKNYNKGGVVLHEEEPDGVKYVLLANPNGVPVYFNGFKENALVEAPGLHSQQCECVLFPATCDDSDWVLFIECKYTQDLKTATDVKNGYPQKMIAQIIETVNYFRKKGIMDVKRRATAIVSFPTLMEEFNSTFFSRGMTETEILMQYNIMIRATNTARIISTKRIKPGDI
jgi:hypothetical protein